MKQISEQQLSIFPSPPDGGNTHVAGSGGQICDQVLIRLVMSGMYPIRRQNGKGWIYFITEKGEYVGTCKDADFNEHWKETLYFRGEGQLTEEELKEVRKIDYTLSEEYIERFNKWKLKVLGK
jgi:hypothetical protein